jgi:hypothetical protein
MQNEAGGGQALNQITTLELLRMIVKVSNAIGCVAIGVIKRMRAAQPSAAIQNEYK